MKYFFYYLIGLIYNIVTIYTDIKAYQEDKYEPALFTFGKNKFINIISVSAFYLLILFIKPLISRYIYIAIGLFPIILIQTILNLKCYAKVKIRQFLIDTILMDLLWLIIAIITLCKLSII